MLSMKSVSARILSLLALLPALAASVHASPPQGACSPSWLPTFGGGVGLNGVARAAVVFDDGSGPALYVGGSFTTAGGVSANHIARWNGSNWSALAGSAGGSVDAVNALAVFDDGSGPALYACGQFSNFGGTPAMNIAKWNGTSWSALGIGVGPAFALAVFDDGSGPRLHVGVSGNVFRWDGANWSPLGSGVNGQVSALAVYDDGSGRGLFAGGSFTFAGGNPASRIARWRNSTWTALGAGTTDTVNALTVFDDGSGPKLCAGGFFETAGGHSAHHVARWNGTSWSALAGGVASYVTSLAVCDDGSGPALHAGTTGGSGGIPPGIVARWTGTSWTALGVPTTGAFLALRGFDAGSGPSLYAFGSYIGIGNAVRWDGASWSPLGSAGLSNQVRALAARVEPGGPRVYATGDFLSADGDSLNRVGRWDGVSWSGLGGGLDSTGRCLAFYDDGTGEALYAGGDFLIAGGVFVSHVAKWNGTSWSALGSGIDGALSTVNALEVFDDGSGPALYAGGDFTSASGVTAFRIARWDGSSWSAVGIGMNFPVASLLAHDDGSGVALYAGGAFTIAGSGLQVYGIARWNGASWSALGSGPGGNVLALAEYDDGSGLALYAGGTFTASGGAPGNHVARWNGSSWSALAGGTDDDIVSICAHDDGTGNALYAGGSFTQANGTPAAHIARWNGTSWSALGSGVNNLVSALARFDGAGGAALIAGGNFGVPESGDGFVARWANTPGCGVPGISVCEPGTGGVMACPCGNPPAGAGRGCDNSSNTGGASLAATGISRVSYDTVVFATSGEGPSATSVVLQGNAFSGGGVVFGQGVRCITGTLKRLYVKTASGGSISAPQAGDLSVSARSAALGDPIAPGSHREYGVYYRDPNVLGGCPASSTFNITQQLDITWAP